MRSRKAQCQAPPDNPETGDTYEYHGRERRSCAGQKIVQSTKTCTGGTVAAAVGGYTYVRIQARPISTTLDLWRKSARMGYRVGPERDVFDWDVFHCTPSRCGRGRRAAVDKFCGVNFSVWWDFVFFSFYLLRTHTAY